MERFVNYVSPYGRGSLAAPKESCVPWCATYCHTPWHVTWPRTIGTQVRTLVACNGFATPLAIRPRYYYWLMKIKGFFTIYPKLSWVWWLLGSKRSKEQERECWGCLKYSLNDLSGKSSNSFTHNDGQNMNKNCPSRPCMAVIVHLTITPTFEDAQQGLLYYLSSALIFCVWRREAKVVKQTRTGCFNFLVSFECSHHDLRNILSNLTRSDGHHVTKRCLGTPCTAAILHQASNIRSWIRRSLSSFGGQANWKYKKPTNGHTQNHRRISHMAPLRVSTACHA